MVTITKDANRADLAECMSRMTAATAALARRGHEGKHLSCEDCDRYALIHAHLDALLTNWERAES